MALGKAVVNILANLKPLRRGLMSAKVAVKSMVKTIASGSFKILRAGLTKIAQAAKIAAAAILGIGIASVKVAMDAQETENLFVESMGEMGEAARKWAMEYSKSMGLYETDTKKMLGTLNVMLSSMGLGTNEAFKMSKQLTELANDMASFYNLKPEEAFQKIQAGITGEVEPLKRLGILVNESTIQRLAMKDATIQARVASEKSAKSNKKWLAGVGWIAKETKRATIELTEQEKVMLRYRAILDQTGKAQGDMGRTLNSTTNVFRTINAQLKTAAENIGKVFLPMVTKVGIAVRDWLTNNQDQIIKWADAIRQNIQIAIDWVSQLIELGRGGQWSQVFAEIGKVIGKALEGIIAWIKEISPKAVDIGRQIGEGFWGYLKDTEFGQWLIRTAEKTKKASQAIEKGFQSTPLGMATTAAGTIYGRATSGPNARLNPEVEARMRRYQEAGAIDAQGNTINQQILNELRKLNRQVQDNSEE